MMRPLAIAGPSWYLVDMSHANTIGGTDAAAIVCAHYGAPYFSKTAWAAYLRWLGEAPQWAPSGPMLAGTYLEPGILRWYRDTQRVGWEAAEGVTLRHGWRRGLVDMLLTRATGTTSDAVIIDAKRSVLRAEEWGTDDAPIAPLGYRVQLAWYALIGELVGYRVQAVELVIYDPHRDSQGRDPFAVRSWRWSEVRPEALEWAEIVQSTVAAWQAGSRPELDASDEAAYWLATHCAPPTGPRDSRPATIAESALVAQWRDARRRASEADREAQTLAARLIESAGGLRLTTEDGRYIQAQRAGGGTTLDSARLRAEHPALFAAYSAQRQQSVSLREHGGAGGKE